MAATLEDVLQEAGVDAVLGAHLVSEGWTVSSFGVCALDLSELDASLNEIFSHQELTLLQRSQLRSAFQVCSSHRASGSTVLPGVRNEVAAPTTPSGSWHESFAPKLDGQSIQQMKKQFLQNYPSEILDHDSMPSTRLLSLVHHQLQKGHWAWVPWKFRLSVSKSEEIQVQRQAKQPKIEGLSLHALLIDEPPALEVSNSGMGLNSIRNLMDLHNVAIAMCRGAHLANLKGYSHRFMHLLSQRVDPDTGLRTANVTESQAADRQVWGVIADLMNDRQWTMDDCLHELTHVRQDLASLLQLRPKLPKPMSWPSNPSPSSNFKGKGKSQAPKGKGKSKAKVQWITEIRQADGSTKPLCMRFQVGKCKLSDCKFSHQCAYPLPSGQACGSAHGALEHKH